MKLQIPLRASVLATGLLLVLPQAGCVSAVTSLFNDQFLSALGAGSQSATLPGDAPAIVLAVENRTSRTIEAFVSYRVEADTVESFSVVVAPGDRNAQALVCPVGEITLGDVGNLDSTGVRVRLGNGTAADPYIDVEPFGVLLKEGANYDCGDGVTFAVVSSGNTLSGYRTVAFIERSGSQGAE